MFSIADNQRSARLIAAPFPVFVIDQALDPDIYQDLSDKFPSIFDVKTDDEPVQNNTNYTRSAPMVIGNTAFDERWHDFFRFHVSQELWLKLLPMIADAVRSVHPDIERRTGRKLEEMSVGMRGSPEAENSDIRSDCQFAMNSPVTEYSTVRGAHIDNPNKIFNALLYCRDPQDDTPGGDLQVFRFQGTPAYGQNLRSVDLADVEPVETVHYRANTLVLFINSPISVHGVTPRPVTQHCRRYINFLCEYRDPLFEIEQKPRWARTAQGVLRRLKRPNPVRN